MSVLSLLLLCNTCYHLQLYIASHTATDSPRVLDWLPAFNYATGVSTA